eukprot:gene1949-17487_t
MVKYSQQDTQQSGNDRDCNGGGVFIAYRGDLILTEQEGPRNPNMKVESLYANLHIVGMPAVCIGVLYRPPSTGLECLEEVDNELSFLTSQKHPINLVLGGDLNLPSVNWQDGIIQDQPQYGVSLNEKGANKDMIQKDLEQIRAYYTVNGKIITELRYGIQRVKKKSNNAEAIGADDSCAAGWNSVSEEGVKQNNNAEAVGADDSRAAGWNQRMKKE